MLPDKKWIMISDIFHLRTRMRFKHSYLLSCLFLTSFLCSGTEACWGTSAPDYGDMTSDYDLLVGSELVLNCSLKAKILPEILSPVSSSNMVFEKGDADLSNYTRKIDDLSIQLRIPAAQMKDSGLYYCRILTSNTKKPLVCGSKVSVGYPPKNVSNFKCISRNYENLTCTWDTESSNILTKYTIVQYFFNFEEFEQKCPDTTEKPNSCEWTRDTDPIYAPLPGKVAFSVKGNNTLGISIDKFLLDGFAIVIPNSPESLKVVRVGNQSFTIEWKPPKMRNLNVHLTLEFQVWIGKLYYNSSDFQIFDAGNDTTEYTLENLIPFVSYNVSVRCRSIYAKTEDMWSSLTSMVVQTLPDVPYKTPEIIPEAYELHLYEDSRSISLYWKAVPELYHNGEKFYYHINYFRNTPAGVLTVTSMNSSIPFVEIQKLSKNSPYTFHIHSANREGISEQYGSISVDVQDKILSGPESIRAISQNLGQYNLSWITPGSIHDYVVFWCSSLKPWLTRCDSPVEWMSENLTENSVILNLTDTNTNFQFAVVSKTENSSSGMQWASCIVPHKAALGKIRYVVIEQKTSTSLKLIWKLDCEAQKAVVNKYEIIYCRIYKNEECKVANVEPNAESYLLEHLRPFSNYSVKIRAFNKDNLPSEDSDSKQQTTLPGAPSGPPQNVKAYSKSNSSFRVSWLPPLEPNGIITRYVVSYNDSKMFLKVKSSENEYSMEVNGLNPYSTYAIQIEACVFNDCSVKSQQVMVQTDVAEPGYMDPPRIETVNSTHLKVSWSVPSHPNGPIDFYVIEWHEEYQNATTSENHMMKVSAGHSVYLGLNCSRLEDLGIRYLFYVRAANLKNGSSLLGPLSEHTQATACIMSQGLAMIIGIAIGGTLALAFFVLLIYKLVKWMREKIHQVKSITIRLPKGLEGPETNPLNNYEYFKNGLNENIKQNSIERLSYIINENENKNRHGSGSSQFSNSSADELIFKNGKCTKFGRKPSGDSSGCSSMSSNTTPRTHLSSDSGTESDFAIPPSPDSAIAEQSLLGCHKPPMPILMEVHDQLSAEQPSSPLSVSPNKQLHKYKNTIDDMMLKVDQPYSKFGVAGNSGSSVPWGVNPLVFYSCNLANSEPSVFDGQKTDWQTTVVAPYSKVGLAKSSGDIMGISSMKEIGYSKFGYPTPLKRFSIPPSNVNPVAVVMFENTEQDLTKMKKLSDNKMCNKPSLKVPSQEVLEDCGYIKFGLSSKKPSAGYVPFHDLKVQQDHNPSATSTNPSDRKNLFHPSSVDKDQVEIPDDIEWSNSPFEGENGNLVNGASEGLFNNSFLPDSVNGSPKETIYNSFRLPSSGNFDTYPQKLPFEPDLRYSFDSSPFCQNIMTHNFVQNSLNGFSNTNPIFFPNGNLPLEESQPYQACNGKTDSYDRHNEVVVNPMTLRNGYVPFSTLSDSVYNRTLPHMPNSPLTVFSHGVCTDADNYVTPSNKGDLRLLRDDSHSKAGSGLPANQKDSRKPIPNGIGYSNGSVKYILKPLPKMESEICEV